MRMPLIDELPPPPPGRSGWPWTESSPPLPPASGGKPWPNISIVTPSFNQAEYLEETVRSVLLQGYPNLEFFVLDGGSTDGSVEILRRYDRFLTGWVSERDKGQSDAINRGFAKCSGAVLNWLCSDDVLFPGALHHVGRTFLEHEDIDVVAGAGKYQFDDHSEPDYISTRQEDDLKYLPAQNKIVQPSCFFRRELLRRSAAVRTDLHYAMDGELWCYFIAQKAKWFLSPEVLSTYRITGANKAFTGRRKILEEVERIYDEYCGERVPLTFWMRRFWRPLDRAGRAANGRLLQRASFLAARSVAFLLRSTYPKQRIQGLRTSFMWYDA
jgi:glycosyltransferase involved in cell wall biosynthesis